MECKRQLFMPIFVCLCSLGYNLLYIFVGHFYPAIHLGSVRYQIVMLFLESGAYLRHHVIIQIKPVVGYDSLRKPLSTYDFSFYESGFIDFVTLAYDAVSTYLVK